MQQVTWRGRAGAGGRRKKSKQPCSRLRVLENGDRKANVRLARSTGKPMTFQA